MGTSSPSVAFVRIRRLLGIVLGLYLLSLLVLMLCQRNLLYFPTRLAVENAEALAAQKGLVPWLTPTGKLIGWKSSAATPSTESVLIVHGNAGSAIDRDYFSLPIREAETLDVYILEYPGYGPRDGSPGQHSFLNAAEEAFDLLSKQYRVYIVAESLGTGVAAHLARTREGDVAGMLLFVPYDNLVSLAQSKMPAVPVRAILWDQYNPAEWMKRYEGPVCFVLAENDEIIPAKFGRALHDNFTGPKQLQIFPGARHNEVAAQSADWWKDVIYFWRTNSTQ